MNNLWHLIWIFIEGLSSYLEVPAGTWDVLSGLIVRHHQSVTLFTSAASSTHEKIAALATLLIAPDDHFIRRINRSEADFALLVSVDLFLFYA